MPGRLVSPPPPAQARLAWVPGPGAAHTTCPHARALDRPPPPPPARRRQPERSAGLAPRATAGEGTQATRPAASEQAAARPGSAGGRGEGGGGRGGGEGGSPAHPPRLQGRFSYKMVKAQPVEVLTSELRWRRMPTWGRKDQLASRLYSALSKEGRALGKEESVAADAALGLSDSTTTGADPGWDSGSGDEDEVASSAELQRNPLLALQASASGRFLTEHNQERLLSNSGGLQLSFLWGGASPSGVKHATTCLVRTIKSVWLFECGEDTQRHLARSTSIAWGKLERIFISGLAADNILGLPGFLCTISAAREKGHEAADTPVHLYGPQGLADYVNTMLSVSRTYLEMPVVAHEFCTGPVPPEELEAPRLVNPRSRLYVTRLPPDQLNPEGYHDAEIRTLLSRHTRKRSNPGIDMRAGVLPLPVPPPGDPGRTGLRVGELTWTLRMDHEWVVRAAPLRARQPAFGYMLLEADRAGRLYVERATELGVEPGVDFTRLKDGESVELPDGRVVHSADVLGPSRRGRRVAVIGSCLDSSTFAAAMVAGAVGRGVAPPTPCDLVVHSLRASPGAGADAAAGVAAMAGATAAAMGAKDLVLWQQAAAFVDAPAGADEALPARAVAEARAAFGSDNVSLAGCFWCYEPERVEAGRPAWAAGAEGDADGG